jgi:hypothetical protein
LKIAESCKIQVITNERGKLKMKYVIITISCLGLVLGVGFLPASGSHTHGLKASQAKVAESSGEITWEVPIAAGIYYPSDGPVPENLTRYYRVRCWPGCHTGSSLGKYPDKKLNDKPIFPTSTVNAHSDSSSETE